MLNVPTRVFLNNPAMTQSLLHTLWRKIRERFNNNQTKFKLRTCRFPQLYVDLHGHVTCSCLFWNAADDGRSSQGPTGRHSGSA